MPRLPRLYIKGSLYFITCRGEDDQDIFKDEGDYAMFLELLKKYKEQYGIKIFAYCQMPNHLHMLIEMTKEIKDNEASKPQEISDFMHNLNNAYTKYFNSRYERKGHLFRERFKAAIVEKETYLLQMTAYIHLNPKKLNMVVETKDYPYSSYSLYLCDKNIQPGKGLDMRAEINEVMGLLNNQDYSEFVAGMTDEVGAFLHKNLSRGGIIGSEEFIQQVKSQVKEFQVKPEQGQQQTAGNAKRYKLFITASGLVVVFMLGAGGAYFYMMNKKSLPATAQQTTIPSGEASAAWDDREWDIKLIPASGGMEIVDTLDFVDNKFISARLFSLGYRSSNYSISVEHSGKIVWETMQSSPAGTASWHGEIEQDKMTGILSLRQSGKDPQDFSFVSIGNRRRQ